MSLDRRSFLKLLGTAALIPLVPKVVLPYGAANGLKLRALWSEEADQSLQDLLRPSYQAWLKATDLPCIYLLTCDWAKGESPAAIKATYHGPVEGTPMPCFHLNYVKAELPAEPEARFAHLLALQEQYPWPEEDWNRAVTRARIESVRARHDTPEMVELLQARQRCPVGILPRVLSPENIRESNILNQPLPISDSECNGDGVSAQADLT